MSILKSCIFVGTWNRGIAGLIDFELLTLAVFQKVIVKLFPLPDSKFILLFIFSFTAHNLLMCIY